MNDPLRRPPRPAVPNPGRIRIYTPKSPPHPVLDSKNRQSNGVGGFTNKRAFKLLRRKQTKKKKMGWPPRRPSVEFPSRLFLFSRPFFTKSQTNRTAKTRWWLGFPRVLRGRPFFGSPRSPFWAPQVFFMFRFVTPARRFPAPGPKRASRRGGI